jgi:Co/Zn/Cd efflux system component
MTLNGSPAKAASYFIYVAGCGVIGKVIVSLIASTMGRRTLGIVFGFIATVCLVLAGYFNGVLLGTVPLFIVLTAASAFFVEGASPT